MGSFADLLPPTKVIDLTTDVLWCYAVKIYWLFFQFITLPPTWPSTLQQRRRESAGRRPMPMTRAIITCCGKSPTIIDVVSQFYVTVDVSSPDTAQRGSWQCSRPNPALDYHSLSIIITYVRYSNRLEMARPQTNDLTLNCNLKVGGWCGGERVIHGHLWVRKLKIVECGPSMGWGWLTVWNGGQFSSLLGRTNVLINTICCLLWNTEQRCVITSNYR